MACAAPVHIEPSKGKWRAAVNVRFPCLTPLGLGGGTTGGESFKRWTPIY